MQLQFFKKNGNLYIHRSATRHYIQGVLSAAFLIGLGLAIKVYSGTSEQAKNLALLGFCALAAFGFLHLILKRLVIDGNTRTLRGRHHLLRPGLNIPLDAIEGFELEDLGTAKFLHINYERNGRLKRAGIYQDVSAARAQAFANELEDIINSLGDA